MLDTSKLLGLRLTQDNAEDAPSISAKIGSLMDPASVEPVVSAQSSSSISAVSGNNFILNMVGSRTDGGTPVMYFIPPLEELENNDVGDNIWGNISIGNGETDTIGATNGFDYDSTQLTIGTDLYKNSASNGLLGVFVSYHDIDSDVKNAVNVNTQMDYYQLGVYGKTAFTSTIDLTLAGSAGYARVDSNRGAASGDTHGFGYTLGGEFASDIAFEKLNDVTFTPYLSIQAATLGLRDYSEVGTGAQRVSSDRNNQLFTTLGVKAKTEAEHFGMTATPQGAIGLSREWIDDPARSTSVALGGGPVTTATSPDVDDNYVRLQGSYTLDVSDNMSAALNYTGMYNSDVDDNLFGVSARYTW